jgi:hypothetical protein
VAPESSLFHHDSAYTRSTSFAGTHGATAKIMVHREALREDLTLYFTPIALTSGVCPRRTNYAVASSFRSGSSPVPCLSHAAHLTENQASSRTRELVRNRPGLSGIHSQFIEDSLPPALLLSYRYDGVAARKDMR